MKTKRSATFKTLPRWQCDMYRDDVARPGELTAIAHILVEPQRCRQCGSTIPAGETVVQAFGNIGGESLRYRVWIYLHTQRCV
jgi:hypothetical protein